MIINGIEYKFYEISDVDYVLLVAPSEEVAIEEYKNTLLESSDVYLDNVIEIEEVPYNYAKKKFELLPEITNYPMLLNDYYTFDKTVEFIVDEKNDGGLFILWDYETF